MHKGRIGQDDRSGPHRNEEEVHIIVRECDMMIEDNKYLNRIIFI